MAFVCVLQSDQGFAAVEEDTKGLSLQTVIGHDDVHPITYSLLIQLTDLVGFAWEISFSIIEFDGDVGVPRKIYSGVASKSFLSSREDRSMVAGHVAGAAAALVERAKPAEVFMCTIDRNLPLKALQKYELIARFVRDLGYTVHRSEAPNGQRIWSFSRSVP